MSQIVNRNSVINYVWWEQVRRELDWVVQTAVAAESVRDMKCASAGARACVYLRDVCRRKR